MLSLSTKKDFIFFCCKCFPQIYNLSMAENKEPDYNGCVNLLGGIVRQAVDDFLLVYPRRNILKKRYNRLKRIRKKSQACIKIDVLLHDFNSAKAFLESEYLEHLIELIGEHKVLNTAFLLRYAKGKAELPRFTRSNHSLHIEL